MRTVRHATAAHLCFYRRNAEGAEEEGGRLWQDGAHAKQARHFLRALRASAVKQFASRLTVGCSHTRLVCVCLLLCGIQAAAQDGRVSGWRGDGSGRYPDATPPLPWGRNAGSVTELSAQSRKPKDEAPPRPDSAMQGGVIRDWLVLGPMPITADMKAEDAITNAAAFSPDENDKAGELSWRVASPDTGIMDLCSLLHVPPDRKGIAAYAHAYIYSPSGAAVAYNALSQGQGCLRVWLNGAEVHFSGRNVDMDPYGMRALLPLNKGWNRLLVLNAKTRNERKSWWTSGSFHGGPAAGYEESNIVWKTQLPMPGSSAPLIMGDRLFFTGESGSLLCADKASGKLLWIRTLTYHDFATEEERKANAALFEEMAPLVAQLKQLEATDLAVPRKLPELEKDFRPAIEREIAKRMLKVSKDRYEQGATYGCEAGDTAPAPVTDGKHVYILFGSSIVACYDRDGNCKWTRLLPRSRHSEFHGFTSSPLLLDGKLVIYQERFTVLDALNGAVVLDRPLYNPTGKEYHLANFYSTGCVIPVGKERVIYYANGEFVRVSDGKTLTLDHPEVTTSVFSSKCATPVVQNGVVCAMTREGVVDVFQVVAMHGDQLEIKVRQHIAYSEDAFPYYYEPRDCASPLLHDGLCYCVNDFGLLTVLDAEKGGVVYQKLLDIDTFVPFNGDMLRCGDASSPTLGGNRIYIWGNQGTSVVLDPGRVFKSLARNRLENCTGGMPSRLKTGRRETTIANPVFEGGRIYYRGEYALYCLGSK